MCRVQFKERMLVHELGKREFDIVQLVLTSMKTVS